MTAQAYEKLIYKGETYPLASEPLSGYLQQISPEPQFLIRNTSCWRGYIGTWEIADERLFLISLNGQSKASEPM
ncbi:MAG TPA: hypothetical protein VFC67_07950 [Prolixibacteraceae bacterium]|nr:hypothetical protein [Prolixibacteraceae bacterium]